MRARKSLPVAALFGAQREHLDRIAVNFDGRAPI
jgi:hypothetical protein